MDVDARSYHRCQRCASTFLDPAQLPTPADELAHYETHENNPADPRYRTFLNRLAQPLAAKIAPASRGLDYGCGPGPALAIMLREAGHSVEIYDPFFADHPEVLTRTYDFITCSEVVEHFHQAHREFTKLDALLRPGGWLGIMTQFQTDDARFANWHYRKDPTHVVFYRKATFRRISADLGWTCTFPVPTVVLFQKTGIAISERSSCAPLT